MWPASPTRLLMRKFKNWSISGETQQSFGTYCSCFRSTFNYLMSFKWLGRRNQWISGRQGVWFPLELLRTEFFFTVLLNRLWTAGILSVTTLLFAAFRLTAGQPCVEILILLGRCRWWGCFLMISVVEATPAYRFWVQRSCQRGRRGTAEPRGFLYMSCWWGSFEYNSISFSSCSNPVPAHISNTIWSQNSLFLRTEVGDLIFKAFPLLVVSQLLLTVLVSSTTAVTPMQREEETWAEEKIATCRSVGRDHMPKGHLMKGKRFGVPEGQ